MLQDSLVGMCSLSVFAEFPFLENAIFDPISSVWLFSCTRKVDCVVGGGARNCSRGGICCLLFRFLRFLCSVFIYGSDSNRGLLFG